MIDSWKFDEGAVIRNEDYGVYQLAHYRGVPETLVGLKGF